MTDLVSRARALLANSREYSGEPRSWIFSPAARDAIAGSHGPSSFTFCDLPACVTYSLPPDVAARLICDLPLGDVDLPF